MIEENIEIEKKLMTILKEYKRIIDQMNEAISEKNLKKADFLLEDAGILQNLIFELIEEDGKNS
jgi:uncharacterized protein YjbK